MIAEVTVPPVTLTGDLSKNSPTRPLIRVTLTCNRTMKCKARSIFASVILYDIDKLIQTTENTNKFVSHIRVTCLQEGLTRRPSLING